MLKSKLQSPVLNTDIIDRPRVVSLFEQGADKPLILVSAPAGFGKSTAASQYLKRKADGRNVAWLSLDESLNDFSLFLQYFISSIENVKPGALQEIAKLSNSSQLMLKPTLADQLVNELIELDERITIVLDDYHTIVQPRVHKIISNILSHPIGTIQLILITRRDPSLHLGKLRLYGNIKEIRMGDLAFDLDEFTRIISVNRIQQPELKSATTLLNWTEGWILGIRMMIASGKIPEISDTDRKLPILSQDIDKIITQLISQLPADFKQVLMLASLCRSFNIELIDELIDHAEIKSIRGSDFLEKLKAYDLFIIIEAAHPGWFRFHNLFRLLLSKQFQKENSELASSSLVVISLWFASHGKISEGVSSAIEARKFRLASKLIQEHRFRMYSMDQFMKVRGWLKLIPKGVIINDIDLLLAQLWIYEEDWHIQYIPTILSLLEKQLTANGNEDRVGEYYYHKGYFCLFGKCELKNALLYFEKSKSNHANKSTFAARRELYSALARQMLGDSKSALKVLDEFEQAHISKSLLYLQMDLSRLLVLMLDGRIDQVDTVLDRFFFLASDSEHEYMKATSWYISANLAFQRYNWDQAEEILKKAVRFHRLMNYRLYFDVYCGWVIWQFLNDRAQDAIDSLNFIEEYASSFENPVFMKYVTSLKNRLKWLSGDHSALKWASSNERIPIPTEFFCMIDIPELTRLRILLTMGNLDQVPVAIGNLTDIECNLHRVNNHYHDVDLIILKAIGVYRLDQIDESKKLLDKAMKIIDDQKTIRAILELSYSFPELMNFIDLNMMSTRLRFHLERGVKKSQMLPASVTASLRDEVTLTLREQEIARMIVQGLRNKEIGENLFISVATVKSHLTNIYKKLEVANRTSMVRRINEMKLVS